MSPSLPLCHELEAEWRFRIIDERNLLLSMEMSFFSMPLYMLDMCPENRDESNGNSIVKLWLQFILIFRALHSQLRKGHTTKKDIPMLFYIEFLRSSLKLTREWLKFNEYQRSLINIFISHNEWLDI